MHASTFVMVFNPWGASCISLLQEAKNGRGKCRIFVNPRSKGLRIKAKMLEGYVEPITMPYNIISALTALSGS